MKQQSKATDFFQRIYQSVEFIPLSLILILLHIASSFLISEYVLTDQVYYNTYSEQVTMERIDEQLETQQKWKWVGYSLIPLMILIKMGYTALCLNIGTLFAGFRVSFKKLFQIAIIAESVLVLASLAKVFYLGFIVDVNVYQDFQYAYPLSLLHFVEPGSIPAWLRYPFQTLNLFEVTYWCFLAAGISWLIKRSYRKSFSLVMSSYGVGLLIWMVFVVFMSINLS